MTSGMASCWSSKPVLDLDGDEELLCSTPTKSEFLLETLVEILSMVWVRGVRRPTCYSVSLRYERRAKLDKH
jgi:hypothetical protein